MALRLLVPHQQRDTVIKSNFDVAGLCQRLSFKYAACKAVGKDFDFANANPEKTAIKSLSFLNTVTKSHYYYKEPSLFSNQLQDVIDANKAKNSYRKLLGTIITGKQFLKGLFGKERQERYETEKQVIERNIVTAQWSQKFTSSDGTKHRCIGGFQTELRPLSEISTLPLHKEEGIMLEIELSNNSAHTIGIYGGKNPTFYDPNEGEFSFDTARDLQSFIERKYPETIKFATTSISGKQDLKRQKLELRQLLKNTSLGDSKRSNTEIELAKVERHLASIDERKKLSSDRYDSQSPDTFKRMPNQSGSDNQTAKNRAQALLQEFLPDARSVGDLSKESLENIKEGSLTLWGASGAYTFKLESSQYIDANLGTFEFKTQDHAKELKEFIAINHPWAERFTVASDAEVSRLDDEAHTLANELKKSSSQHKQIQRELGKLHFKLGPIFPTGQFWSYEKSFRIDTPDQKNTKAGSDSGYASMDEDSIITSSTQSKISLLTSNSTSHNNQHLLGEAQPFSRIADLSLKAGDDFVLTVWGKSGAQQIRLNSEDGNKPVITFSNKEQLILKSNDALKTYFATTLNNMHSFTLIPTERHRQNLRQENILKQRLNTTSTIERDEILKQLKKVAKELYPYKQKTTISSIEREQEARRKADPQLHDMMESMVKHDCGFRYDVFELGKPGRAQNGFIGKLFFVFDQGTEREKAIFRIEGKNSFHLVPMTLQQTGGKSFDHDKLYRVQIPQPGLSQAVVTEVALDSLSPHASSLNKGKGLKK